MVCHAPVIGETGNGVKGTNIAMGAATADGASGILPAVECGRRISMPKREHYLREWRQRRGLTQMQLAERSGRSQSSITEYENGRSRMSMRAQADLARALEIEPWQLLLPPGEASLPPTQKQRPSLDKLLADADDGTVEAAERMVRALLDVTHRRDR